MRIIAHGGVVVAAVAVATSSCGPENAADRAYTVRDSAGITIVESVVPAWAEDEGWTLSGDPILDIGVLDGDPVYQLYGVRDVGSWGGVRIVVADGGSEQLRVYDARGGFVHAIGGEGEGPGEFSRLSAALLRPGDTIVALDTRQRRLTAFDGEGALAWSAPLPEGGSFPPTSDGFDDGSFVLDHQGRGVPGVEESPVGQIFETTTFLVRYSADVVPIDTIGEFRATQGAWIPWTNNAPAIDLDIPFGRRLRYATRGAVTYVGEGNGYEIQAFGRDGSLIRIIRRLGVDLRVTDAAVDSFWSVRMTDDPSSGEYYGRLAASTPRPEQRAPYGALLVDSGRHLWVAHHGLDFGPPTVWDVFAAEGQWLGEVTVPEGFQVFEVGEDYVLGVATDDLDVEHVRMYELRRSPS
jgi:hypothetical protein